MAERKLTVLQVLPALQSGGVERGTLEVGKYLVEHGHRSLVISSGGRLVEQLLREGSEHFTWDIGKKSLWTLRLIPRLRRFLIEHKIDILHVRSRMPAWICYLAWKGMDSRSRPRFITTVHGLYSVNAYSAVMTKGERVIAVSETVRDYILKNYPDVPPEKIVVIPRGIDPAEYPYGYQPPAEWLAAWQTQYPQLAGKKVLTLPGRITRLKGHEDFIELIARLRKAGESVHGLIVGGASAKKQRYLEELKEKVRASSLAGDITFTGQRDDLREIMAVSDIVLSLSTQPESFGRTVLEALSMGVPVIGYDHGGVGEQLRKAFPAGLIPLGDIPALVRKYDLIELGRKLEPLAPLSTLKNMLANTIQTYEEVGK
jgi:glycosyltransferase involved in cell wall biosynthesis